MVKIYISSVIDAPADRVWATIRDFNALPKWHPAIKESHVEGGLPSDRVGCIRNFNLKDGGNIREQLLTLSDYDYSCTYSILESPLGVSNYIATLKVTPVTDGNRSFWHWEGRFTTPAGRETELAELVANDVYSNGIAAVRQLPELAS